MHPPLLNVLLVDDFSLARERTRRGLLALGVLPQNIVEASDGRSALDLLKKAAALGRVPDLVITDWNMPEMSGLDLIKACRADVELRGIKILVASSEGERGAILEALEAGADDYAVKPLKDEDLAVRLDRMLKKTG